MTPEEYYWYVRRPQELRVRVAGFSVNQLPQPQICKITFEGTNCQCKIDGENIYHKIIPIGSNVTVEVIPNEGYMFTQWSDGNIDNPRTWTNVQGDFVAKAALYEDFGPLCFTCETGDNVSITLRSMDSDKRNTPVNEICSELNLQYSLDGINWNIYDMSKIPNENQITLYTGEKVYFKAATTNPNGFGHNLHFFATNPFARYNVRLTVTGSIMYLLDSTGKTRNIPENGFKGLFTYFNTPSTVSPASIPKIPADNLGNNCCEEMFKDCYQLKVNETDSAGRIPWSVNAAGIIGKNWNKNMIIGTDGDFTGDPVNGTTYYIG